jgi:hypothetical protein
MLFPNPNPKTKDIQRELLLTIPMNIELEIQGFPNMDAYQRLLKYIPVSSVYDAEAILRLRQFHYYMQEKNSNEIPRNIPAFNKGLLFHHILKQYDFDVKVQYDFSH